MVKFCYLDNKEKEHWLPLLFDILYDNMRTIAPSKKSYDEEKGKWLLEVSPALDKAPRRIILAFSEDELVGYVQYYTCNDLLMIEEIQIIKKYQRTRLFYQMCKNLEQILPDDIEYVEAYADKRNVNSQLIMKNCEMQEIEGNMDSPFVHFRGSVQSIKNKKLSRN